ncbi:WbqC family protein [Nisaea nitritireducens]|uniref:WbqC family protein n=1 Tax=Nisaea nitritireducens TaxID=568392 RepID=UPI001866FF6F|nr:WbqC family protein [Nisaea nitritireducens]
MRVAIMQPTWLPWMGYFDLIDQVDLFVFLDTVQFTKRSWHCRNRIKTSQGSKWISLPVSARFSKDSNLNTAIVHPEHRMRKFLKTLRQEYSSARAFEVEFPVLAEHLSGISDGASLAEMNINFIHFAMERLKITTKTVRAQSLPNFDGRVMRLIEICRFLGADTYVSVPGSADYIGLDGMKCFEEAGINLVFQRYDHPIYQQCGSGFLSFMSIVDILLNAGEQAGAILRSGHREPIPALEFFGVSRSESSGQENNYGAA